MFVSFDNNANISHFLSVKDFLYYSVNHIFVWLELVLHDEIVAFVTLAAVQNKKKMNMAIKQQQICFT